MTTVRQLLFFKGDFVWSIRPEASVFDALRMMADKDVGVLLVMVDEKLVGILSERDYARKVVLLGKMSRETLVSDIMTRTVFTVHPDQTIDECMQMMTMKRIRHLPVVDGEKVLGVISIGDVVRDIIYRQREEIKNLEKQVTH